MRPRGRSATDSLYFDYPYFPPPDRRAWTDADYRAPVAIVGAGPVGMTAALALARAGVRAVVFDSKDTVNDGSRAICVARPSFYILEQIGAVAPFLEKSLGWTTGRSFYRGRQILEFEMPDSADEKFRPMYNLQQQYIEQFLHDACARHPLIDMRWQSTVTDVTDRARDVQLAIRDPGGCYDFAAQWVLACDGAHSPVRKIRGLRLCGENFEGRYVIADIRMDHDYPTIRRALFDPDCRRGGTVLIHKQPDDIWRIDYQLRDDETQDSALREDTVRASVAAVLHDLGHDGPWELEWWSIYSANTLALDDYRDGRVFFAGDSAHIVPIFGVRGLNSGLADAANIGWKLGWVLAGRAGPALLDSYSPERRGATLDVFANASKSARFMTPPSPGWAVMRDAALSLALTHPFAGQLANPRQMTAYTYADSPAILDDDPEFGGGPGSGAVMPDMRFEGGFLSDYLGPGFSVLCFGPETARAMRADGRADLTVIQIPVGSEAARRFAAPPGAAYLIRPDMHIAARWHQADVTRIFEAITMVTGVGKETQ